MTGFEGMTWRTLYHTGTCVALAARSDCSVAHKAASRGIHCKMCRIQITE